MSRTAEDIEYENFLVEHGVCPECGDALLSPDKDGKRECFTCGWPNIQRCRVCGCTHFNPCEEGCWWVEEDLCSACVVDSEESDARA